MTYIEDQNHLETIYVFRHNSFSGIDVNESDVDYCTER